MASVVVVLVFVFVFVFVPQLMLVFASASELLQLGDGLILFSQYSWQAVLL